MPKNYTYFEPLNDTAKARAYEKLEKLIHELFAAEEKYGYDFYNQVSWIVPYEQLRKAVGVRERS